MRQVTSKNPPNETPPKFSQATLLLQSAGELRLHKDISELNLPKSTSISFPNGKDDLMNFEIFVRPDEGYHLLNFSFCPSEPWRLHTGVTFGLHIRLNFSFYPLEPWRPHTGIS
ncbi:probable NEDD8-conjugating enzyme Ubc12-like [Oryza brachyantha]|uniref:probable NEDD8-conjugating enzyme Ubc12-like n=1 Tax=Oryza brachyantha TaxID=4533 RepID=UPI001ADD4826|nr:probable NEDD8-conjugating enzyme Ubc12-like [Oryza brachyantha]